MISTIVAVDKNQGIGYQGSMPWPHLSEDLTHFKKLTVNNVVIMGSATWHSLPFPLPNRTNLVISRFNQSGPHYACLNIDEALELCDIRFPEKDIFIIGGQKLYDSTMHLANRFYITEIDATFQCDRFFNLDFVRKKFPNVTEHSHFTDPIPYTIKEYNL